MRLGKNTKVSGKNGYDKLQRLYKQANKVYYKGIQSNGMIERLNIEKIANAVKEQLNPLYKALGVEKIKILIVKYIDSSYIENSYFSKNICILLKNSKTLFIRKLIEIDKIDTLNEISNEEVESITFDEKYLESMNLEQYLEELKRNTIRKLKEVA